MNVNDRDRRRAAFRGDDTAGTETRHNCETCNGEGSLGDLSECPDCDGLGYWFE